MICILIKCSASLFNHTVQYASAPVALKLHPSCCYNTVLEMSADHIISYHFFCFSSSSVTYSDKKRVSFILLTSLICQLFVILYGLSITQSIPVYSYKKILLLTYFRINMSASVCLYLLIML